MTHGWFTDGMNATCKILQYQQVLYLTAGDDVTSLMRMGCHQMVCCLWHKILAIALSSVCSLSDLQAEAIERPLKNTWCILPL